MSSITFRHHLRHLHVNRKLPSSVASISTLSSFVIFTFLLLLSSTLIVSTAVPVNEAVKDEIFIETTDSRLQPEISTVDEISTSTDAITTPHDNEKASPSPMITVTGSTTTTTLSQLVKRQPSRGPHNSSTTSVPSSTPIAVDEDKRKAVIKDAEHGIRPIILTKSPLPFTVTNEVYRDPLEDLQFLCHHYHQDEFVISAHIHEQGCRLECVFLKSSGTSGDSFLDDSESRIHNINEGQSCDPEMEFYKCVNGSCIEPPETGKAIITIINGTFVSQDEDSPSDPYVKRYVKIFLDQNYLHKTKAVENINNPFWGFSFVTPVMTSDTQIAFLAFDRDSSSEKLLLTVQTTINFILMMGLNATATCGPPGSPRGQICYIIRWHPQQLPSV